MTSQAHVIGRDHPTPGDFAAAMHGVPRSTEGDSWSGGAAPRSSEYDEPKKNWYARILDDAKIPLVVAMLFFIFSLPAINVVISQYLPSLIQSTGQLSLRSNVEDFSPLVDHINKHFIIFNFFYI